MRIIAVVTISAIKRGKMPKIHLKKTILIDQSGANVGALVPAYLSQAETFDKLSPDKIYQGILKSEIARNL